MSLDLSEFYQTFFEEALEHLAEMESLLLALNLQSPDVDDLNAIFRAAHSIKGGSGMFGFNEMTDVTHILETLLDRLRKSELQLTEKMLDAFLQAADLLKSQIDSRQRGLIAEQASVEATCTMLRQLASDGSAIAVAPAAALAAITQSTAQSMQIEFSREGSPLSEAVSFAWLLDSLADLGAVEVLDSGDQAGHHAHLRLNGGKSLDEVKEIFSFFLQPDQYTITIADGHDHAEASNVVGAGSPSVATAKVTEKRVPVADEQGFGFFSDVDSDPCAAEVARISGESSESDKSIDAEQGFGLFADADVIPHPDTVSATQVVQPPPQCATPAGQDKQAPGVTPVQLSKAERRAEVPASTESKAEQRTANTQVDSSIRVNVEKVDQLINMVGELVITQAMLVQTASGLDPVQHEHLLNGVALLERNTRDLQEAVMSIRMMPMSFVFSRFPRMVRDLAGKLKKEVNFKTQGEGTELDKGLIEKITDPLTHLVRNSLDHGIESPDVRAAKGKDPKGTLVLRAFHQGGTVVIEVQDDGAGLNREKILGKARERGMLVSDTMTDQDVWSLILAPGFSTAEAVTDVSGRGVGMDVVKRNIEGLGGRVEIESSTGIGTKMTIRLPLTLAILDGLSINVGKEVFIVPLTSIIESLQPRAEEVKTVGGEGWVIRVRGEYLPLIVLHQVFNIRSRIKRPEDGTLMIVEADGVRVALLVDELLGQHQVVIKSLETNYRKVLGISGATIMGDGRVALILDITGLVRMCKSMTFSESADVPFDNGIQEAGSQYQGGRRETLMASL